VRCYSDAGYDKTITTGSTSAEFQGIEPDKAYTVEVTAYGMTQSARAYISANPATIIMLHVDAPADDPVLNVRWDFSGTEPTGGWLLLYAVSGSDSTAVISCAEPSAVISPRIPGVTYDLTIQAADGSTVFKGRTSYDTLDTEVHIMRLGTIAIATNPFELFLDYGNQIKARSHAEQTFLIQLANGTEGYLPTEKAEKGGHYSAFLSSGQVGHIGGEQLVRETLQAINGLF
jgi:hypothetical protein